MLLKTATLVLLSSFTATRADNTANLCSDDIENLQRIKPSTTGVTDIHGISVVGTQIADADHFVMIPNQNPVNKVMVYIPGTTDRPELSSCLLKSLAETLDYPVVGLSYYGFIENGGAIYSSDFSGKCTSSPTVEEQVECLKAQHTDAIYGGNYGATHFTGDGSPFWNEISFDNSIVGRLVKLFRHLDTQNPGLNWWSFVTEDGDPDWTKISLVGHSQGAGHVAYLGKTKQILGGVMISGPQDECIDCPEGTTFWINEDWTTITQSGYTALVHGDDPHYGAIADNLKWDSKDGVAPWSPTYVNFGLDPVDSSHFPLVTNVKPADTSTCGEGEKHSRSIAIDACTPYIEQTDGTKYYLYGKYVWPGLVTQYSSSGGSSSKSGKATKGEKKAKSTKGEKKKQKLSFHNHRSRSRS